MLEGVFWVGVRVCFRLVGSGCGRIRSSIVLDCLFSVGGFLGVRGGGLGAGNG